MAEFRWMNDKKGKGKKVKKVLPLSEATAARIKALRKAGGYTSAEIFAFKNNFNRSQYIAYETGLSDLRLSTLHRICQAHGITLAEFFQEGFD